MSRKPVITIPATPRPDSGLITVKNIVYVTYTQDGVRKRGSIGTRDTPQHILTAKRDTFYAMLKNRQGATVATRSKGYKVDRAARAKDDPDYGIMRRKPWVVKIDGKVVASCDSKREAREARDEYLKIR